jgi:hypothetical protein
MSCLSRDQGAEIVKIFTSVNYDRSKMTSKVKY